MNENNLKIRITNSHELEELIKKLKKATDDLAEIISQLNGFEIEIEMEKMNQSFSDN